MARAHEVSIGADGRAFEQAIKKDVIKPVDEAARALDDLGDSASDAGREGSRDLDKLEDKLKDVQRQSDKTGTAVGRNMDDGFDKAKKGANEFGQEANNTAKETAASFDGSAESIVGAFQEISANALAGFGPAGAAAGLALAAGIGVGMTALDSMGQQSEKLKEQVKQNFEDMAADGIAAWEGLEAQNQRLTEAYKEHEGEITRIADLIGLPFETVAAAWAGNKDAVDTVSRAYGEMADGLKSTVGVSKEAADATIKGWEGILQPLNETTEGYDLAKEKATRLAEQITQAEEGQRDQIQRTRDADEARYEAMKTRQEDHRTELKKTGDTLRTLADGTYNANMTITVNATAADREFDRLQRRADRGIDVAFNNTGRMLWE